MTGLGLGQDGPRPPVMPASISAAPAPISSSIRCRTSVRESVTCSAIRSTSTRRSVRTSLIKGTKALSWSQPVASGKAATGGKSAPDSRRDEIAQNVRLPKTGRAVVRQFQGEQPLVDDVSKAGRNPRPVEIEARRRVVRQGMKAGARRERPRG